MVPIVVNTKFAGLPSIQQRRWEKVHWLALVDSLLSTPFVTVNSALAVIRQQKPLLAIAERKESADPA